MQVLSSMVLRCLIALFVPLGAQAADGVVFWNKLGGDQEVLNSEIGPNLDFGAGNNSRTAYLPGVFGDAVTLKGNYSCCARIRNLVLDDLSSFMSAERGTIAAWYKQTTDPVPYQHNPYRIFDGSFGLDSPLKVQTNSDNQWDQARLLFSLKGDPQDVEVVSLTDDRVGFDISGRNGEWIHIGAVWDRGGIAGTTDTMRLYVNGQLVASSEETGWTASLDGRADIAGGNDANIAEKFLVDNIVVYDYAKTDFSDRFNEDPTDYEFAEFSINYAMLWFRSREAGLKDWVLLRGSFVLGDDTDGIDPATEDVTATVGSHTLTIPAGSFFIGQQGNGYRYVYRGTVDDSTVFARLSEVGLDAYRFFMWIRNMDLTDTANPMTIGLAVGDDSGEIERRLRGVLH